jgi:hypothetical protein
MLPGDSSTAPDATPPPENPSLSPTSDAPIQPEKHKYSFFLGAAIGVVVAGVAAAIYFFFAQQVTVPDLRGQPLSQAIAKMNAVHLSVGHKTYKGNPATSTVVLAQSPAPGTSVRTGTGVDLVLAEAGNIEVPSLIGKSLHVARRMLAAHSLQPGNLQYLPHAGAREVVLQQSPAPGLKVGPGATIDLTLSEAPGRAPHSQPSSAPAATPGQLGNVAGSWRDANGVALQIDQSGGKFNLTARASLGTCQGTGVLQGSQFQVGYACAPLLGARTTGRCAGAMAPNWNSFRLHCTDSRYGQVSDVFSR